MRQISEADAKKRIWRLQKNGGLRSLREEHGLTQTDVAGHFGIAASTVSRWEAALTKMSGPTAIELLDLLDVS